METPIDDKVEILSVIGDNERSWQIDRYKATVFVSIVSVILITGGIIWLATQGGENASAAGPIPTGGELKFNESPSDQQTLGAQAPFPSVKNASPLEAQEDTSQTPSSTKSPTPTPTTQPGATATPTSTPGPSATPTPVATAMPVPATPSTIAPTVQVTELKIEDSKDGEGPAVKSGDSIRIHYIGTLTNGTKFDSSYDRGAPFETQIGVGKVIEGWDKGIIGMKPGGKRKLTIPADMAYGGTAQAGIPANSALIFEVELIEIK